MVLSVLFTSVFVCYLINIAVILQGDTPLHYAVKSGSGETCQVLLNAKADPSMKNELVSKLNKFNLNMISFFCFLDKFLKCTLKTWVI